MAINANVEALKRAYGHWRDTKGDSVAYWLAIADDDIRVNSAADEYAVARFGAQPRGKEGLRQYLTTIVEHWEMELYEVQRFIASGEDVAVVVNMAWRNRATNKLATGVLVDVWTFRDGKAAAVLEVFDTASMVAAATPG